MGTGLLLVSPSILLVAVFVYGLIGWNIKVSLSDWRQAEETSGFDTSAFEARSGEMQARSGTLPGLSPRVTSRSA